MANQFKQGSNVSNVHFSNAMFAQVEHSRMTAHPSHLTTFNAGELIPIYCREVLPDEDVEMSMDFVVRQNTVLTPTMGRMEVDFFAFFVPNRIVNKSWKEVEGENSSGAWIAPQISLAPLTYGSGSTQIPVGSVADYYGFPTQMPLPKTVTNECHDLKFRGYVMIWNEWFRDQNYQPPIPISYLNVYQGFFDPSNNAINLGGNTNPSINGSTAPDGSVGAGAIAQAIYGSGHPTPTGSFSPNAKSPVNSFRATSSPLKVNKLHDYFTSVLPSPQKGPTVLVPASGTIGSLRVLPSSTSVSGLASSNPLKWARVNSSEPIGENSQLHIDSDGESSVLPNSSSPGTIQIFPANLRTESQDLSGFSVSVDDLRMSAALQQYYETLSRGGSRYRELVQSFFGIEADDPYSDIPVCLGHFTRDLDLYQTAQTSASSDGSTPQGNLAAFGYTSNSGLLFKSKFLEHGYIHVFAVVRHKNVYPSYLSRDNFRLNALDFYSPPLANISEQPVYTREINPFFSSSNSVFGYQEAWAEYRFEPDYVTGLMRPGVDNSLSLWNYADDFSSSLQIADANFMYSNSRSVLDRTLAVTSSVAPQLKGQFIFHIDKTLPMPTYSVPGLDII